ncbi:hypothetical protein HNR46_002954 [Haloferula luteola]|uniref:Peptidase n=1 Tax=Haloferula luteola TaxID=595692 RepID=A0A840V6P8_9BACT|nr:PepSY-associated TM helix domain-containing protein [Haloferula luteola]MBB5352706.1 hypothetical protein [Haloferula luteola]
MKRGSRYWLLTVHRDGGYFFAGMVLIFALSGIALNHRDDWDPNFVIERQEIHRAPAAYDRETLQAWLVQAGISDPYRAHDFPSPRKIKVFTRSGSLLFDLEAGDGDYEAIRRRPLFYQLNSLHRRSGTAWKLYSDCFSMALIAISLSGLFLARGRYGFRWRGAALTALGLLAPLAFLWAG